MPAPKKKPVPKKQTPVKKAAVVADPDSGPAEEAPAPSLTPVPKVAAAGVGGAAYVVLLYLGSLLGVDLTTIPAEVITAVGVLITFGSGYLKRS